MRNWSRSDVIGLIGLFIAIVACIAAILALNFYRLVTALVVILIITGLLFSLIVGYAQRTLFNTFDGGPKKEYLFPEFHHLAKRGFVFFVVIGIILVANRPSREFAVWAINGTPTHTATNTSTPMNTPTATNTSTPTNTPVPTNTPTPKIADVLQPAPTVLGPRYETVYGPRDRILLRWTWGKNLQPKTIFVIRLWHKGDEPKTLTIHRDGTEYLIDTELELEQGGSYRWDVAVVRLVESGTWERITEISKPGSFVYDVSDPHIPAKK